MSEFTPFHTAGISRISGLIRFSRTESFDPLHPVFDLTCVTTGGSPTNVTWTRDGAIVPYDDEHVLTQLVVNEFTITYKNVLTVRRREPGDYTCTVSNIRGSHTSEKLQLKGTTLMLQHTVLSCHIS